MTSLQPLRTVYGKAAHFFFNWERDNNCGKRIKPLVEVLATFCSGSDAHL